MKPTPTVTVVMPVYNTQKYVHAAIMSVLNQTYLDFELLIIDDAGTDSSIEICSQINDQRIRIISQENRGLAGARNTGIRNARGAFLAFLDSDDLWEPQKLESHVQFLRSNPTVGVCYAASAMIDDEGNLMRVVQRPRLKKIDPQTIFLRNPVGNGSAPVIRREVFDDIAMPGSRNEPDYFDESFRQSEDIECWIRIALTTNWTFEGIDGIHTRYRINEGGLSANVIRQYETWLRVRSNVREIAPRFAQKWEKLAEAYQLRYLARRCIRMSDGALALSFLKSACLKQPRFLFQEPLKTMTTFMLALSMRRFPNLTRTALQAALVGA